MPLFSNSNSDELILILDVQSSLVRGSLVIIKKWTLPNVIFTYNANIPWKPHTDSSYLIKLTLRAVSETLGACMRNMHIRHSSENIPKKLKSVHFALSSPWIVSQAKTLTERFPKEMPVTKAHLEKLIDEERKKLMPSGGQEVDVIEEKIFDVRLNGYSVPSWIGKSADSVDVSYTMSLAGTRMMERFREACASTVRPNDVFFHSSLLLQFIGMRICEPAMDSYALAHIHGELTDVAVMDHQSCVFFGSFPLGVRTLVRKIALATATDQQAADSLLTLYIGGHMDPLHAVAQTGAIETVSATWGHELEKVLGQRGNVIVSCFHYIISAVAHDDFFVRKLRAMRPGSKVELLSIETILPHVVFSDRAERRRLTGLYAVAINSML